MPSSQLFPTLHHKHFETDEKAFCRIDESIIPFYNTIHRLVWWVRWIQFLFLVFFLEKTPFDLLVFWSLQRFLFITAFFFHFFSFFSYSWWNYFLNNFSLIVRLLRLVCFIATNSSGIMIIDQQNTGIHFLLTHVVKQQFLYCFKYSSSQFLILNIFFFLFPQTFLLINSISLCFDPWFFCHLLAKLASVFLAVSCAFLDAVKVGYCA